MISHSTLAFSGAKTYNEIGHAYILVKKDATTTCQKSICRITISKLSLANHILKCLWFLINSYICIGKICWINHRQLCTKKMTTVLAFATLGDVTQRDVSYHPRWPRQIRRSFSWSIIADSFANKHCQMTYSFSCFYAGKVFLKTAWKNSARNNLRHFGGQFWQKLWLRKNS